GSTGSGFHLLKTAKIAASVTATPITALAQKTLPQQINLGSLGVTQGTSAPFLVCLNLGASSNVVLELSRSIPENRNYLLFFDQLVHIHKTDCKVRISAVFQALGTARANRISGCRLPSDAEMKKDGKGSHVEREATVDGVEVRVVKWYDGRGVNIASTFGSAEPLGSGQRYDRKKKESWLLYRRDCDALAIAKKELLRLLAFKASLASCLCIENKDMRKKRGRPSLSVEAELEKEEKKRPNSSNT
ncbi:hypothetical protein MRX96_053812, partial [Rhipicephalus microplus]